MFDQNYKSLMATLSRGKDFYDAGANRMITISEGSEKLAEYCCDYLHLSKSSKQREIDRALRSPEGMALLQVIEEIIDDTVKYGYQDDAFMARFVETKIVDDETDLEFYVPQEVKLKVAQVSGSHHDLITQKLGAGTTFTIPMFYYAVKAGTDMRLFLTGKRDWNEFVTYVTDAYVDYIRKTTYNAWFDVFNTSAILPRFKKSGTLSTKKDEFDQLITDVEAANNAPAAIVGVKSALKKLNTILGSNSVEWADSQKESVAKTGMLGDYEGNELVEIKQNFTDKTFTAYTYPTDKLFIVPIIDTKPIKFLDGGETRLDVTEYGSTMNDQQTVEIQRRMGVGAIVTRQMGVWTIL